MRTGTIDFEHQRIRRARRLCATCWRNLLRNLLARQLVARMAHCGLVMRRSYDAGAKKVGTDTVARVGPPTTQRSHTRRCDARESAPNHLSIQGSEMSGRRWPFGSQGPAAQLAMPSPGRALPV
jgi:hypothetical protein